MVFINWAIDVLHGKYQKEANANLKIFFWFELIAVICNYEDGIASNRK